MLKQFTTIRRGVLIVAVAAIVLGVIAVRVPLSSAGEGRPEPFDLAGTDWVLASIGGEDLPAGIEITARFDEDRVAGVAGCNSYFAGYEIDGGALTISEMGMTMMMCPEPEMELEGAFTSALGTAESYQAAGGTLEIVYADGRLIFNAD